MNNILDSVGARLREERERLGYSQESFAALAQASRPTQFNYESDKRAPDSNYLVAIAAAGADVLYILTGQRAQPPVSKRVQTLLNHYEATDEEGKRHIETAASLLSQRQRAGIAKKA